MTIYRGFATLFDLHRTIQLPKALNVLELAETEYADATTRKTFFVIVSCYDQQTDMVNYCRFVTCRRFFHEGVPVTEDDDARERRAAGIYTLVNDYYRAIGVDVAPGLIAMPRDLQLLDGETDAILERLRADLLHIRVIGAQAEAYRAAFPAEAAAGA